MIHPPHRNAFSGGSILTGRRFPLWWALLALLIAALLFSESIDEDPYVYPDPVGTRITEPLRVILVMDDSGSTMDTDPNNQRYDAAEAMIAFLRELRLPDQTDVVQIVHFADTASADPPIRTTSATPVLTESGNVGGGTSIPSGISEANRIAAEPFNGKTIAVLFTDGQVDSGQIATVANQIDRLPTDSIHLVGLGSSRDIDSLKDASFASVIHVGSLDTNQLKDVFGRVAVDELGMSWGSQWSAIWESKQIKWASRINKLSDAMPWA